MEKQFTKFFSDYKNILTDKKRFVGLIKDLLPGQPLQTNLFLNLYDIGIHTEIEKIPQITNIFAYRFVKKLCDEYGVSRMNADWAVGVWCICYGKNVLKKPCALSGLNAKPNNANNPIIQEEASGKSLYKDLFRYTKNANSYTVVEFKDSYQSTLVIPTEHQRLPVTAVGAGAFKNLCIEDAVMMEGIIEIGDGAYQDCNRLKRVIFPESLLSIGNNAFFGCPLLTSIKLPTGMRYIGKNAFNGCFRLKAIVLPKAVSFIGLDAFDTGAEGFQLIVSRGSYAEGYAKENLVPYKYDKSEDF